MGLVNIISRLPMPVRLHEPHPDPQHPGNSPELRSVVIPGKSHPDGRPMVTRGVDGEIFEAWKGANGNHAWLKNEAISVVSDEEADRLLEEPLAFGFEPGLEAVDATGAEDGSLEADVPHHAVDMNAYSNVPNDDSPRSQTPVLRGVVPGPVPQDAEPASLSVRNLQSSVATDVHDPAYSDFKDHAGQEEPTIRGRTKDDMEGAGNVGLPVEDRKA